MPRQAAQRQGAGRVRAAAEGVTDREADVRADDPVPGEAVGRRPEGGELPERPGHRPWPRVFADVRDQAVRAEVGRPFRLLAGPAADAVAVLPGEPAQVPDAFVRRQLEVLVAGVVQGVPQVPGRQVGRLDAELRDQPGQCRGDLGPGFRRGLFHDGPALAGRAQLGGGEAADQPGAGVEGQPGRRQVPDRHSPAAGVPPGHLRRRAVGDDFALALARHRPQQRLAVGQRYQHFAVQQGADELRAADPVRGQVVQQLLGVGGRRRVAAPDRAGGVLLVDPVLAVRPGPAADGPHREVQLGEGLLVELRVDVRPPLRLGGRARHRRPVVPDLAVVRNHDHRAGEQARADVGAVQVGGRVDREAPAVRAARAELRPDPQPVAAGLRAQPLPRAGDGFLFVHSPHPRANAAGTARSRRRRARSAPSAGRSASTRPKRRSRPGTAAPAGRPTSAAGPGSRCARRAVPRRSPR